MQVKTSLKSGTCIPTFRGLVSDSHIVTLLFSPQGSPIGTRSRDWIPHVPRNTRGV